MEENISIQKVKLYKSFWRWRPA